MININNLKLRQTIGERSHTPSNVSLFLYNAASWNSHRIHYDESWSTATEGFPTLVIDGPLQGDWLAQIVTSWLNDDGVIINFEYTNKIAAYLGETLLCSGKIQSIDKLSHTVTIELQAKNKHNIVTTPGRAIVQLHDSR